MLRKPAEESVNEQQHGNRIKLPEESGIRSVAGFKDFLAMTEASKGSQIELSWTTKIPGQRFVLDMQWDIGQKAPFWTLYEENNGKSKRIWDEPFTVANVDMCYDVLVMTCGAVAPSAKNLSEILKAQPPKEDWSKPMIKSDHQAVTPSEQESESSAKSGSKPAVSDIAPAQANTIPHNSFPVNTSPPPLPPGYMLSPDTGAPVVPGAAPMPAYNMPTNSQMPPNMMMPPNIQNPVPLYAPNVYPANPGFPPPQSVPPNAWQYSSPGGGSFYGQPNMVNPATQNLSMQGLPLTNMPAEASLANLPVDAALIDKQNGISLVDLLIKAGLITDTSLAAALKIQELTQSGKINWEKAVEVLKLHHNKGQNIENFVTASVPDSSSVNEAEGTENTAAFDLLTQAGLISKDDIQQARSVIKKHGGDIAVILQAAQKLDAKTLDAAKICCALQNDGLMKLEQSVIVLNYCSRSRVTFDDALSELNWPNPRK